MATNPPNRGGKGPSVTKQGNKGPIVGNRTSMTGSVQPWSFGKGSSRTPKDNVATTRQASSPSKTKSGWYMGSKSKRGK